jgi:RNA polymerase sigma-70 factor (ECF subfamily)
MILELDRSGQAIRLAGSMPDGARTDDRDLWTRFRAGDREAFTEIYRVHSRAVFRFALLMTGDDVKAAETTQDAFVWLIHHAGRFDPQRGTLGPFLVGVARKLLLRRHRDEQRWVPLEESAGARATPEAADGSEDAERLREAVRALPERYRAVVVLCAFEEKSYEEAAVVMECPVGTVRSRLHRARALLARKLVGKGCPA